MFQSADPIYLPLVLKFVSAKRRKGKFSSLANVNPKALLADGFEDAYLGHTVNTHHVVVAVYDYTRCVNILMERDGGSFDDADEYMRYNVIAAYVGENGPLFVFPPMKAKKP